MIPRRAVLSFLAFTTLLLCHSPAQAQWRDIRDAGIVRGLWVSRWEYRSPEDVSALFSRAASWGITDVYFQVRGRGDAFYRSEIEPWGAELTGILGQDPGWDPLEAAIREARQRGLRIHAWINTFTMWSGTPPPPATRPEHIYRSNPDWIMANREGLTLRLGNRFGYVLATPGNPEVQAHIEAVVLDIVERYPVDGIHYDYIRLPDHDYSYDAVSRRRFLSESDSETYMGWQAGEITGMLERISAQARDSRPGIIFSAAIVDSYERAIGIFAQDPAEWIASGALDYVVPMMYTPSIAEFMTMLDGYRDMIPASCIVAGINLGEMPDDPGSLAAQVHESLLSGVLGHALFSLGEVDRLGRGGFGEAGFYTWLEEQQGTRLITAEPLEPELRSGEARPRFITAPTGAGESVDRPREQSRDQADPAQASTAGKRRFIRWILPAVAGAAVVAILLLM
ncbi:glycoside hydrolase family 10 protein [Gemmatimonadota bacterium]